MGFIAGFGESLNLANMAVTGIILAGGKSLRMGTEKGLVKLHGKTLVEHVIGVVKELTEEIIIISNKDEYRCYGYPVFSDIIKDCGPLGGIYTGLIQSGTQNNLIVSCDIPFINSKAIKFLVENSDGFEVTVPVHAGKIEPLCAVYNKTCSTKLKQLLLKKEFKIMESYRFFKVNRLDVSTHQFFSDKTFENINSKEELLKAEDYYYEN